MRTIKPMGPERRLIMMLKNVRIPQLTTVDRYEAWVWLSWKRKLERRFETLDEAKAWLCEWVNNEMEADEWGVVDLTQDGYENLILAGSGVKERCFAEVA